MKNIEILKFNLFNFKSLNRNEEYSKTYLKGMLVGALITDGITFEEFEELKELLKERCE